MEIVGYYDKTKTKWCLSHLIFGGNVVEFEDEFEQIETPTGVLDKLNKLYSEKKISMKPVKMVRKKNGNFRVEFRDCLNNIKYLELRKEI